MYKKLMLLTAAFGFAGSVWAGLGDPYIGEQAIGWQTTSAVTLNSSDNAGWFGAYGVAGLINGGAFQASVSGKLPFL